MIQIMPKHSTAMTASQATISTTDMPARVTTLRGSSANDISYGFEYCTLFVYSMTDTSLTLYSQEGALATIDLAYVSVSFL